VSLLNQGTDFVTVFPQIAGTDSDGNTITAPSRVEVRVRAVLQPLSSTEGDEGFTSKYRLRLIGYAELLGARSAVEWQGRRYAIDGEPRIYNGSRRTAHVEYVMVRR
jgi:hypothetical protein